MSATHKMQIYNIIPDNEGNWKAVLVGADELVVSYASRDKLIETVSQWAEKPVIHSHCAFTLQMVRLRKKW